MSSLTVLDVFRGVLEKIESAKMPYMVVGSVGSIIYGEPRMTKDMDVVVHVLPKDTGTFPRLFSSEEYYCPPPEVLRDEIVGKGQFNLIHHQSGLKVDIIIRKDSEHGLEEFRRRKRVTFWEGFDAFVATAEDVILKKLAYYREGQSEKHLRDIRGILANTEVDGGYIEHWTEKLGLSDLWKSVSEQ